MLCLDVVKIMCDQSEWLHEARTWNILKHTFVSFFLQFVGVKLRVNMMDRQTMTRNI